LDALRIMLPDDFPRYGQADLLTMLAGMASARRAAKDGNPGIIPLRCMCTPPVLSPTRLARCPRCGSERLQRCPARDPVDRLYRAPSDIVRRLFAADMKLDPCRVCRLHFYDI